MQNSHFPTRFRERVRPPSRAKEPWRKLVHAKHLETTLPLKNHNSLAAFATRTSARLIHTHTAHTLSRTLLDERADRCTDSYPRGQTTAHVRAYTTVRGGVRYVRVRAHTRTRCA